MSNPYIGEIRMFGGTFAPAGWAFCNGALMPISENDALFTLIGTTYGGDGESTFGLPDLQGRLPLHMGTNPQSGASHQIGEKGGTETVALNAQQIPIHSHNLTASADPSSAKGAVGNVLGRGAAEAYASEFTPEVLAGQSISTVGGSQPHDNMHPFLTISFIISLFGIFPHQ